MALALEQDLARQREAQVQVCQARIKEHQKMSQAGAGARAIGGMGLAQLQENVEQAPRLLRQVQDANEAVWRDMYQASLPALEWLQKVGLIRSGTLPGRIARPDAH